jgi:TonB-linked SusC/RagA family outer membrane protein
MTSTSSVLAALLILANAGPAQPQQPTGQQTGIVGTVIEKSTRRPLAGAQVFIRGTPVGRISDAAGRYTLLNVPPGARTVSVQLLGFTGAERNVTVTAGSMARADFELAEVALALDEIVVTGTPGGTRRRALGNSLASINASQVSQVTVTRNAMEMIAARTPGVSTQMASGLVGGMGAPIHIRGMSSIGLSNTPLVYIDGIRMNSRIESSGGPGSHQTSRINDIAPEDIASIEIIKGPSASTLYGTEASNGVIQIITKRGVSSAPVVTLSAQMGTLWFPDPVGYVGYHYALIDAQGKSVLDPGPGVRLDSVNLYAYERDFGKGDLFKNGALKYYSASAQGGFGDTRYFTSFDWDDELGVHVNNWGKKYAGRANIDFVLPGKVSVQVSSAYLQRETGIPTAEHVTAPLNMLVFGKHPIQSPETRGFSGATPEAAAQIKNWTDIRRFTGSALFNHRPADWFGQRFTVGLDYTTTEENLLFPRDVLGDKNFYGSRSLGERRLGGSTTPMYTFDYSGTATFNVNRKIRSASSLGAQYYITQRETFLGIGNVFPAPALTTISAAAQTSSTADYQENKSLGFFVQEQVEYNNRVFLTGAVRADDNSAFGTDFAAAIYPKVSAAWVVHEEPFWKFAPLVSSLRLRGAFGAAGKQPDVFAAVRLYNPTPGPGGTATVTPGVIGNPSLKPERGEEVEVGFDAGLFNGRATVEFTYYNKNTKDAIISRQLPPSLGFPGTQFVNIGKIKSWGTELAVNGELLRGNSLGLSAGITFTHMDNRVDDLGGLDRISSGIIQHVKGQPLGGVYTIKVVSAEFQNGVRGGTKNEMCDAGADKPPVPCADAPLQYWGRSTPTWEGGVNSTVTLFRHLRLYARAEGRGGHIVQDNLIPPRLTPFNSSRQSILQDDPIVQAYRKLSREPAGLFEGGFVKLREVSVSYEMPQRWAHLFQASRATVSLQGRNVATLWRAGTRTFVENNHVPEPEVNGLGDFSLGTQGIYPPAPTILGTIKLTL